MQSVTVDIAHDLRSPIARHRNRLAEVLAKPGLSSEVVQDIEGAIGEMDSIVETFDSLLRIAQLESGERLQSFERLDLEQVLQQISDLYLPVAEDAGCALVRSIAPDERPLIVDGDPQLLSQLLINLIENAIRHCPQRTQIVIGAAREEAGIAITVADDGPGIPEGERSRVFERFYRLDRSRGSPGSGLGLALVAAISRLHGAEISILDNEPGLRVRVVFPAAAPF
jgi:signal transduction histidine kinase